jgi:metallo-beta-lactamase family protein
MAVRMLKIFGHHPEAMDAKSQDQLANGESPFSIPELELCTTRDQSKYINEFRRPAVIIAGSGMCTGGRIKHHILRHIDDARCTLLFVGYQASGTLGREILDGARHTPVRQRSSRLPRGPADPRLLGPLRSKRVARLARRHA